MWEPVLKSDGLVTLMENSPWDPLAPAEYWLGAKSKATTRLSEPISRMYSTVWADEVVRAAEVGRLVAVDVGQDLGRARLDEVDVLLGRAVGRDAAVLVVDDDLAGALVDLAAARRAAVDEGLQLVDGGLDVARSQVALGGVVGERGRAHRAHGGDHLVADRLERLLRQGLGAHAGRAAQPGRRPRVERVGGGAERAQRQLRVGLDLHAEPQARGVGEEPGVERVGGAEHHPEHAAVDLQAVLGGVGAVSTRAGGQGLRPHRQRALGVTVERERDLEGALPDGLPGVVAQAARQRHLQGHGRLGRTCE